MKSIMPTSAAWAATVATRQALLAARLAALAPELTPFAHETLLAMVHTTSRLEVLVDVLDAGTRVWIVLVPVREGRECAEERFGVADWNAYCAGLLARGAARKGGAA